MYKKIFIWLIILVIVSLSAIAAQKIEIYDYDGMHTREKVNYSFISADVFEGNLSCSYINDSNYDVCTNPDTYNTSAEIQSVIATQGYYNETRINTTILQNESGNLGVVLSFWDNLFLRISDFFTKGTSSPFLSNDSSTIFFNTTLLNETIDLLDTDTWNTTEEMFNAANNDTFLIKSERITLLSNLTNDINAGNDTWNGTADFPLSSLLNDVGFGNFTGNVSWNEDLAFTLYLNRTSEGLYTTTFNATYDAFTDTNTWNTSQEMQDAVSTVGYYNETRINTTSFENQSGSLGIVFSWFTTVINNLIGSISWSGDLSGTGTNPTINDESHLHAVANLTDYVGNTSAEIQIVIDVNANNYISNNSDVNFLKINATDWDNVSITESQVNDLVHTVNDTDLNVGSINASSINVSGDVNIIGDLISDTLHEFSDSNVVLALTFDDHSVTDNLALDSSKFNNHGKLNNVIFNSTGGFNNGGAYEFDGVVGSYISAASPGLNVETIAVWIKSGHVVTTYEGVVSFTVGTDRREIMLFPTGSPGFVHMGGAGNPFIYSTEGGIDDGNWHHIVGTYNGSTRKLYVDGNEVSTTSSNAGAGLTNTLRIGHLSHSGNYPFTGTIDEVVIYNRALSQNEIKNLYLQREEYYPAYLSKKNYFVNSNGDLVVSGQLNATDWSNATLTESQINDLLHTVNGTDINVRDINASSINVSGTVTASNLSGNLTWIDLYSYPVACPTYSSITQLDDSVTCTDSWIHRDGDVITGDYNFIGDVNITGNIIGTGQNLTLATIGNNIRFKTIQDLQNLFHSSGVFNENSSVDFIQLNDDNTFNVSGGSGTIRTSNNATSILLFFDWTGSNNIAIALNEVIYVGIEYNAGSPQIITKSTNIWDSQTEFPLGSIIRDVSGVHLQREDHAVGDHATNMINRLFGTSPFARDNRAGGLILGTSGLNITVSAGTLWEKLNEFPISAIDTSVSDTFDRYYRNGTGGWFVEQGVTVWNNTHYDDGTGTLNLLGNNKWSVEWVYLEVDGEIVTQYGREQFNTEGEAEGSSPPTTAPDRIIIHSKLIGRIIWQEGATSAEKTQSVFVTTFSVAGVVEHGNLAGLNDPADHTYALLIDGKRALTDNWFAQFGIYSNNWTNVTITENQITNLNHIGNCSASNSCLDILYSNNQTDIIITESQISNLVHTTDTWNTTEQMFNAADNNTFQKISEINFNTSADIQAVAVGGDAIGTVGNLAIIDNAILLHADNITNLDDSHLHSILNLTDYIGNTSAEIQIVIDTNINNYISNNSNVNFLKINATDWSNVTLTESQITNLNHIGNCSASNSCLDILYSNNQSDIIITESQISDLRAYLTNGTDANFLIINATDWSNVTIIEDQITDLVHTTDTWNTSQEMRDAVNNSGVKVANSSYSDDSALLEGQPGSFYLDNVDTWNTSKEIEGVVSKQGYYNETRINTTSLENQSGSLGIVFSWLTNVIKNFIPTSVDYNSTTLNATVLEDQNGNLGIVDSYFQSLDTDTWNTSADIQIVIDVNANNYITNNSDVEFRTINSTTSWSNVSITESQISDLVHTTDTDTNESARFDTLVGTDCTGTDKVSGVDNDGTLACDIDVDTWNTSAEIQAVIDVNNYIANSTHVGFLSINSTDWSNVTITEGQISNLVHTTDTFNTSTDILETVNGSDITLNLLNITGNLYSLDWTNVTITEIQVTDLVHTTDTWNSSQEMTDSVISVQYYNASRINTTALENQSGTLGIVFSYFTSIFLELTDTFGGDATGTYDNLAIIDNAHLSHWDNITNRPELIINGTDANFLKLNATDWTNVTILENQITNLNHIGNCSISNSCLDILYSNNQSDIIITESQISDLTHTIDTQKGTEQPFLSNDSSTIFFNTTLLNETVILLDTNESTRFDTLVGTDCTGTDKVTGVDDAGVVVCGADTDTWNTSLEIIDVINNSGVYVANSSYSDDSALLNGQDGTFYLDNTDTWNTTQEIQDSISPQRYYNASRINTTILQNESGNLGVVLSFWDGLYLRISDFFTKGAASPFLSNDSTTIFFNTTLLNETIILLDTNESARFDTLVGTDCTAGNLVIGIQADGTVLCVADIDTWNTSADIQAVIDLNTNNYGNDNVSWNEDLAFTLYLNRTSEGLYTTTFNATYDSFTDTDTHAGTEQPFLSNDSLIHYFNTTLLNETIILLDTNESTRFDTLVGTDCTGTDKVNGIDNDGSLACDTDVDTWNTSDEIFEVVDNNTFQKISEINFNTSADIQAVAVGGDAIGTVGNLAIIDNAILLHADNITNLDDSHLHSILNLTDYVGNTTEEIQDSVWTNGIGTETLISVTYQDGSNNVDFIVTDTLSSYTNDANFVANGTDANFLVLNATDWGNITLTESQITNLNHIGNCSASNSCLDILYSNNQSDIIITEIQISDLTHTVNTQKTTQNPFLSNDSSTIFFNTTLLNETIVLVDTNESVRFDTLVGTDCSAGDLVIGIQSDGTVLCTVDVDTWNTTEEMQDSVGLAAGDGLTYDDGGNAFNVDLGTSIDSSEIDTNAVKDDEMDYSAITLADFLNDALFTANNTDVEFTTINSTTSWLNVSITEDQISDLVHTTDTDTHVIGVNPFLSNDSVNMYFNTTLLNDTIILLDTNESTRFDILVGTDCSAGDLVIGVQSDGTVLCATDIDTWNNTEEIQDSCWLNTLGGTQTLISVTYQDGTDDIDFEVTDTLSSYMNDALFTANNTDVEFRTINSTTSWDNVSITEDQISDLVHTTDTWNTTVQMFNAANNNTFLKLSGGTVEGLLQVEDGAGGIFMLINGPGLITTIGDQDGQGTGNWLTLDANTGFSYIEAGTIGFGGTNLDSSSKFNVKGVTNLTGDLRVETGGLCISSIQSCTPPTNGDLDIQGGDIVTGTLRFGTTTTSGVFEFEDGSICVGDGGCTASSTDGTLYVETGMMIDTDGTVPTAKSGFLIIGDGVDAAAGIEIEDGSMCIGDGGCTAPVNDGDLLLEGDLDIQGGNIITGTLRFGTTTSSGSYEFEDGGVCIGSGGCTASASDGSLSVDYGIIIDGDGTPPSPKSGFLIIGDGADTAAGIEIEDGSMCIGNTGCTPSSTDGTLYVETSIMIDSDGATPTSKTGFLIIGDGTDGAHGIEIEDGSMCIGNGGCTAPAADGDLSLAGNLLVTGTVDGVDIAARDHAQSHTIVSHSDTTGTGAELNTLTDNSIADTLHRHSELSASDGTPDKALYLDSTGIMHQTYASRMLAYKSTAQTIGTSSTTTILFNLESYDNLGEYSTSTGIFTATAAGYYTVSWAMLMASSANWDAGEAFYTYLSKNDGNTGGNAWNGFYQEMQSSTNVFASSGGSVTVFLAAGNTLRIKVVQQTGSNLNTWTNSKYNYFSVHKLS